ncbi:MAG: hypothetical protein MRY83_04780 [Flavobacteriales bacterium]|nr:hypothetical protein [Flavobacteriales bacterium]
MPKTINYPKTNFEKCLILTKSVYELNGDCSFEDCAKHMNRPLSGVFTTTVGSSVKYGLLHSKSKHLRLTDLGRSIISTYDLSLMKEAFIKPPLFEKIINDLKDQAYNKNSLTDILFNQYEVPKNHASKVAKYFLEGMQFLKSFSSEEEKNVDNSITTTVSTQINNPTVKKDKHPKTKNETNNLDNFNLVLETNTLKLNVSSKDDRNLDIVIRVLQELKNS